MNAQSITWQALEHATRTVAEAKFGGVARAEDIAGVKLKRRYNLSAPKGVNGRNSDNTLIQQIFHWEPSTRLRDGLERTYRWIHDQITRRESVGQAALTERARR